MNLRLFSKNIGRQKFQHKVSAGFTFVEVLIYIALLVIGSGALFSFGLSMLSMREKAATMRETIGAARFLEETLKREIRSAQGVDIGNSIFDQIDGKIILNGPDGEVIISALSDQVSIKRGESDPEFLNPDNVAIRNFKLSKQVSIDGVVQFVGFSFSAEANYPSAGELAQYQYVSEVNSGATIRSQ